LEYSTDFSSLQEDMPIILTDALKQLTRPVKRAHYVTNQRAVQQKNRAARYLMMILMAAPHNSFNRSANSIAFMRQSLPLSAVRRARFGHWAD
jgi:hypothetical protein